MTDLKIGIQTRSLGQSLRRALETAGQLEADGVEIDLRSELPLNECSPSAIRQIRKLLDDYRLGLSAVTFPTRRGFDEDADLDRRIAATCQAMQVGYQLGARVLISRVGTVPPLEQQTPENESWQRLTQSLTAVGMHGQRVGTLLAAQTGSEPGLQLAELIQAIPEGTLGADFHPAELIKGGFDQRAALDALGPRVLHVHAADAVRDLGDRRVVDVPLGRGTVDLPELLAGLQQYDYQGWITIERREAKDPVAEIGDAVAYLRNVMRDG